MSEPIEIPVASLSDDALQGLVEEFVSRDGTDYGDYEVALETKVQQVLTALKTGAALIYFDEQLATTHIVSSEDKNSAKR